MSKIRQNRGKKYFYMDVFFCLLLYCIQVTQHRLAAIFNLTYFECVETCGWETDFRDSF